MFHGLPAERLRLAFPAEGPGPGPPDAAPAVPLPPGPQTHRQHRTRNVLFDFKRLCEEN